MNKYFFLLLIIISACSPEEQNQDENCLIYRSCIGSYEGRYCTNGYKYGEDAVYSQRGVDVPGPYLPGSIVKYSFQTSGIYPTQLFGDFESTSFDQIGNFAKPLIREALQEWASHIDITFEETQDQQQSDLKLICADIHDKAGIGWLSCADNCEKPVGYLFVKNKTIDEGHFYSLVLHEIGHVLGLCHSNPSNIMSHTSSVYDHDHLQPGDIEGIISIYGPK